MEEEIYGDCCESLQPGGRDRWRMSDGPQCRNSSITNRGIPWHSVQVSASWPVRSGCGFGATSCILETHVVVVRSSTQGVHELATVARRCA